MASRHQRSGSTVNREILDHLIIQEQQARRNYEEESETLHRSSQLLLGAPFRRTPASVESVLNQLRKDARAQLEHIVQGEAPEVTLQMIVKDYCSLLDVSAGRGYAQSVIAYDAAYRVLLVAKMLRDDHYFHQARIANEPNHRTPAPPFWLELGLACQSFLKALDCIDEKIRNYLWRYRKQLVKVERMALDPNRARRRSPYNQQSSALKIASLSLPGFRLFRCIELVEAIIAARTPLNGSDPEDYLNLPFDLFPPHRTDQLRNSIAVVASKYGTMLGLREDINLPYSWSPMSRGNSRHGVIYGSASVA